MSGTSGVKDAGARERLFHIEVAYWVEITAEEVWMNDPGEAPANPTATQVIDAITTEYESQRQFIDDYSLTGDYPEVTIDGIPVKFRAR